MKILILGGTAFLGRALVECARQRGHEITLFNRRKHDPDSFRDLETIVGDRHGDLAALRGRVWDAVIDTAAFTPQTVETSTKVLEDATEHYTLISSVSVYADFYPGMDESTPTLPLTEEQNKAAEAIPPPQRGGAAAYGALYGPLKAECERVAQRRMGERLLAIRPGLIVGPHDYTDRFNYWVARVARGGDVLAPGRPQRTIEFIDVRDLADWTIRMVESKSTGVFNAKGPLAPLPMGAFLDACRSVSDSDARIVWVSEDFLLASGVVPWTEMPLWIPEGYERMKQVTFHKAVAAGLSFRPLSETIRDTLAWERTRPAEARIAGLSPEKERALISQWRERERT